MAALSAGRRMALLPAAGMVWSVEPDCYMEETLDHIAFEEPVEVIVGLGLPTRVDDIMEAYTLLNEWPPSKRNPAHAIALNACRAALVGEVDAGTVRATFVAFARRAGLLAPTVDGVIPTHANEPQGQELSA